MNLTLKLIALSFIAIFSLAVWLLVGSYVGNWVPVSEGAEFNWWGAATGSAGSVAAATVASPFLVILFDRYRWLAALVVVAPLLVMQGASNFSLMGAYSAFLYFSLLMMGMQLSSHILNSD